MAAFAPEGDPTSDHLKLRTVKVSLALDSIPEQHVILETLFISLDPYLRSKMTGRVDGLYSPQFNLNEVVSAFGVGRVVRSKDSNYVEGDIVLCPLISFAEYCVVSSQALIRKIGTDAGIPLPEYISTLGVPGFAAWVGIEVVAEPLQPGSNVFISAAAGAVGMYAGQLAKLKGCRVVGSTGSDDKVWTERVGVRNLLNMIGKDVKMQGFMIGSYLDRFGDFVKEMESHLKERKINSKLKIIHGIDSFLVSLGSLFTSSNIGKVVIQV